MKTKNLATRLLFTGLISATLTAIILNKSVFANTGGVGSNSMPSGDGSWAFNCYNNGTCPRWIRVPINTFKEVYKDNYNYLGSISSDAYNTCTNTSKNSDGYVIFTGLSHSTNDHHYDGYNGLKLTMMNPEKTKYYTPSSNLKNLKNKNYHIYDGVNKEVKNMTSFYTAADNNLSYYKIYQEVLKDNGLTESYDDDYFGSNYGTSPYRLAFFCYGMTSSAIPDKNAEATVTVKATVKQGSTTKTYSSASANTTFEAKADANGKATVTVNFTSTLKVEGDGKTYYDSNHSNPYTAKAENKSTTVNLDLTKKAEKICGESAIEPKNESYNGNDGTVKKSSGSDNDEVCVTIKLTGTIPVEDPATETASIKYKEGDCNVTGVDNTHSSGAAGVYSLDYNQSNAGVNYSLGSPSLTSISAPTSLETDIKNDSSGKLSGVFSRTNNPYNITVTENGGINQENHTMPGPETATLYYTYDKVDIYKEDIQTGTQTYDKTEYRNLQYSSTTESSTKKTCQSPTIYREGLAGIQVKNKREVKNGSGNAIIPTRNTLETNFTDISMYNTYTLTEENNQDTIVYMGSKNTDSIKIKTTHTIKRRANDGIDFKYDITNTTFAGYTINAPWNTTGDITTKNGSQQISYDQEINLSPSDERTIKSQEVDLGEYDKVINDAFSSNDKLTIGYNNNISETGLPISASTGVHLYRPWNYNLSFTSIQTNGTSNGQVFLNGGSRSIEIVAKVNNDNNSNSDPNQVGNASYSPDTTVNLYSFTIDDGTASTISDINAYIHSKIGTGTLVTGQTKTEQFSPESTNNPITFNNISVSGSTGDHVCFYATMNYTNSKNDTTGNTHTYYTHTYYGEKLTQHTTYSKPTCFTITSIPTAQIRGGSLYAEGDVRAKVQFAGTGLFGSWVDYGLILNGEVSNFASGKAIDQTGNYNESTNENHPLTIANYNGTVSTPKGSANISSLATKSRIVSLYTPPTGIQTSAADAVTGEIDISSPANYTTYTSNQYTTKTGNTPDSNAKYRYTKVDSGSRITQSLKLDAGITHVIYSEGSITIGSDLEYANENYTSIPDIPQFIIIAKGDTTKDKDIDGINIENDVNKVDAWLITDETINTCTENGSIPSILRQSFDVYRKGICDNALTVNGPVFAKNILLERTGINFTSKAAEVFNITAANYYWAFAKAKENGKTSIVYTRSLAPRF